MIRESRTLASLGVSVEGSTVRIGESSDNDTDLQVSLELVSLDVDNSLPDAAHEQDLLAQAVVLVARLLLGQAHRDKLRKRSEIPPPLSDKQKDERPILPILRPIMSLLLHHSALSSLHGYVSTMDSILLSAKVDHDVSHATLALPRHQEITDTDTLVTTTLLRPLNATASLTIHSAENTAKSRATTIDITLETSLAQAFGPVYTLKSNENEDQQTHTFPDFASLAPAADTAVSSILAKTLQQVVPGKWQYNPGYATLEKDTGVGRAKKLLWTDYSSAESRLKLVSSDVKSSKKCIWTVDGAEGGESNSGLWAAAKMYAES